MFLHVGGDVVLSLSDVIVILSLEQAPMAVRDEYVHRAAQQGELFNVGEEPPKSCIVTRKGVFLSPVSSFTLKRRAEDPLGYLEELTIPVYVPPASPARRSRRSGHPPDPARPSARKRP